jgi:hypothetical protein
VSLIVSVRCLFKLHSTAKTGGKAGAKDSKWLERTTSLAQSYGVLGLLAIQIAPIPVPTAVSVVAGMLAKMKGSTIFITLMSSKFIQLTIGAVATKYALAEGKTASEYLRENFLSAKANGDEKKD